MNSFYEILIGPSENPVSLDEVKTYLRITTSDHDVLLATLISAATEIAEKYTSRWFISRTARGYFKSFELSKFEICPYINVQRSPLQSVSLVEVFNGVSFDAVTDYKIRFRNGFSRILRDSFLCVDSDCEPYLVKVEFVAGYGTSSDVPDSIKTAIKQIVSSLFENRGDCCEDGSRLPMSIRAILDGYKIISVYA